MNIKNLEIGKEYKWRELCNTLEIKVSDGGSRKKDIKKLESLCKYRKEGVRFIIEEIYDKQKRIIDKRVEKPNSINQLMASAIMYRVTNSDEGILCAGINNWLFEIGVVKDEFVKRNRAVFNRIDREFHDDYELTEMDKDFLSIEYSSLRYHFISALEKIKKTKLADYFITCKIGYSSENKTRWTRELNEEELKILYKEKDNLYKKYEIINEYDLLYGNEKIGVDRNVSRYNNFRRDLRKILYDNWNANFEFMAYKVILKNTSDIAFRKIDEEFFKGYNLAFLKSSIYAKRKKSAEKRQSDTIKKYKTIEGEGEFFDNTKRMYVENMKKLSEVDLNKINGIYVDLWDFLFRDLIG